MLVYLAASWSRKAEIRALALEISRNTQHLVISRWTNEPPAPISSAEGKERFLRDTAMNDLSDVEDCDMIVRLSDDLTPERVPSSLATGARMFECGYAYALGKPVVIVGGHQCLFDHLPNVVHLKDKEELLRYLK